MRRDEMLLRTAVHALQAAEPDATELTASAKRVADRLGIDGAVDVAIGAIESCDDVQQLFPAFRAGALSNARVLLIEAHIRDCGVCRHHLRSGSTAAVLDWSAPKAKRAFGWR